MEEEVEEEREVVEEEMKVEEEEEATMAPKEVAGK